MTEGVRHLLGPGVDDAGAEEQPAGLQELLHHGGKPYNDVRHNIGNHHIVAAAQSFPEGAVGENIPHQNGVAVLADAVESGVFIGHRQALVINVHSLGGGGAQPQCGNGEDAAATAQIQYGLAAVDGFLQRCQAQAGGGVAAGAEGEARL